MKPKTAYKTTIFHIATNLLNVTARQQQNSQIVLQHLRFIRQRRLLWSASFQLQNDQLTSVAKLQRLANVWTFATTTRKRHTKLKSNYIYEFIVQPHSHLWVFRVCAPPIQMCFSGAYRTDDSIVACRHHSVCSLRILRLAFYCSNVKFRKKNKNTHKNGQYRIVSR